MFDWVGEVSSNLLQSIKDTSIQVLIVSICSVLSLEAFKKVSLNNWNIKVGKRVTFFSNIVLSGIFSFLILFLFDGKASILADIVYFVLLWSMGWVFSVLAYVFIIKILFNYLHKIENDSKIKKLESDLNVLGLDTQIDLLKKEVNK